MSLTSLLGNKTRTFALGLALTACGGEDIHNHYYGSGNGSSEPNGSYNCDDIYQRFVLECNANGNDAWDNPQGPTYECEQGNWPQKSPEWAQCIFNVPCEEVVEVCDPLFDQSGH